MNLSQDTFNKLVTTSMLLFFMIMFALSWWTGKPFDFAGVLAFLVPMLTHTSHLVLATQEKVAQVKAGVEANGAS